eukprot:IDg21813t1
MAAMADQAEKPRRFRFTDAMDFVLVRVVAVIEAHVAPHGKVKDKVGGMLDLFMAAHEARLTSSPKRDPAQSAHLEASSGIAEEHDELTTYLDDLITDMDDRDAKEKQERDAEEVKRKELREAGKSICAAAVKRGADSNDTSDSSSLDTTPRKKKKTKRDPLNLGKGYAQQEIDLMRRRLDVDERRMNLDEKRLDVQASQTASLVQAVQALVDKKTPDAQVV